MRSVLPYLASSVLAAAVAIAVFIAVSAPDNPVHEESKLNSREAIEAVERSEELGRQVQESVLRVYEAKTLEEADSLIRQMERSFGRASQAETIAEAEELIRKMEKSFLRLLREASRSNTYYAPLPPVQSVRGIGQQVQESLLRSHNAALRAGEAEVAVEEVKELMRKMQEPLLQLVDETANPDTEHIPRFQPVDKFGQQP